MEQELLPHSEHLSLLPVLNEALIGAHFFLFYLFKVPAAALGEYSTLLKHLTADTRSDLEKVWSIYFWVVNQNFNDSTHGKHTAGDTPRGYMEWIHDEKGDVPSFFAILCR